MFLCNRKPRMCSKTINQALERLADLIKDAEKLKKKELRVKWFS